MITTAVPHYVQNKVNNISKIEFNTHDFLTSEGEIVQQDNGQCIPLKGLFAYWTPNLPNVLNDLLKNFYLKRQSEIPHLCISKNGELNRTGYIEIQPNEIIKLLKEKKVLVFTGAGISLASEIPDLNGLMSLQSDIFNSPEHYFLDIVENKTNIRIEKAKELHRLFTATEPNNNHWYIAQFCKKYGLKLATGNIDGLHEKTGVMPIYQTSSDKVEIPNIEKYDIILTIGLSDEGMGIVAKEYNTRNINGRIIAINFTPPKYLELNDYYVEGDSEEILNTLLFM